MKTILRTFGDETVTYYVGENAKDNDAVLEMGGPDDLWFHAKHESSCHVVAVATKSHSVVKHGALLCKQHSKLKSKKVEIMYTLLRNVTRTGTPGQVLTIDTKGIIV